MRADRQRHQRNLHAKSELKTLVKQFETSLQARQLPQAKTALQLLTKKLDMASQRGILHRNVVTRKKSRLSHRLAQVAAAAA